MGQAEIISWDLEYMLKLQATIKKHVKEEINENLECCASNERRRCPGSMVFPNTGVLELMEEKVFRKTFNFPKNKDL